MVTVVCYLKLYAVHSRTGKTEKGNGHVKIPLNKDNSKKYNRPWQVNKLLTWAIHLFNKILS